MITAVVLALSTVLAAAPAMAGEKGGDHGQSFPMPAAAFQQKVTARQAKSREHMEKRAATLNADQAKELRAKFDAGVTKVNAEVGKATADGTVTKEEAKEVRKVAKELRGGHGKHAGRGHRKGAPRK